MPKTTDTPKKYSSFQDLKIWQASTDLCKNVYRATESLVGDEARTLASAMRMSALRFPTAIARTYTQKWGDSTTYTLALRDARRNLSELESHTYLAQHMGYLNGEVDDITRSIHGLIKMTNNYIKSINTKKEAVAVAEG